MMKQLDFFFDYFTDFRLRPRSEDIKTLVAGGKKTSSEVLFLFGKQIKIQRRPYQRNLSLTMKPDGSIRVTAARGIPVKMITKFVSDSWPWVLERTEKFEELRIRHPEKKYEPNEYFTILGKEYPLQITAHNLKRPKVQITNEKLVAAVQIESVAYANQLRMAIRDHYEQLGKQILGERLHYYSQKLQLYPHSVSYRCQKTRWGSCSPSGHISLNWRLVVAPLEVIDYVVVHELSHLKHANHSQNFWKLVEAYVPRWKKLRRWLAENQYAFDFLAEVSELHPRRP